MKASKKLTGEAEAKQVNKKKNKLDDKVCIFIAVLPVWLAEVTFLLTTWRGSWTAEAVPAAVLSEPDDVFPHSESIRKVFLKAFLCGQRGFASLSTDFGWSWG